MRGQRGVTVRVAPLWIRTQGIWRSRVFSPSSWLDLSRPTIAARAGSDGPDKAYRMHRSRERSAAAVADTVMARLVRAVNSSACTATGGPDKPGHDDVGPFM